MKIISFSVYGRSAKYLVGAVENARNLQHTDWTPVFYCGLDVDPGIMNQLETAGGIVIQQKPSWHTNGMFWRYYAVQDFEFDRIMFRDTDSRMSQREWIMIDQWKDSNKTFHLIRDHPYHMAPILGGLWGATGAIKHLGIRWDATHSFTNSWGEDQFFLRRHVYPLIKRDLLVHDAFFMYERRKFKIKLDRCDLGYVGESVDENGNIQPELRQILQKNQESRFLQLKLKVSSFLGN